MESNNIEKIPYTFVADNKAAFEKALLWVNASTGSDFELTDYNVNGVGLAKVMIGDYELPWIFLLGTYYEKFKLENQSSDQ